MLPFGSDRIALRRTPSDGCFSAALIVDAPSRPSLRQPSTPAIAQSACTAAPFSPVASTEVSAISFARSDATSSLPRSTRSLWAWRRQNMLSLLSASTSPFGSSFDKLGYGR